jgi:hypothetical protein
MPSRVRSEGAAVVFRKTVEVYSGDELTEVDW